METWVYTELIYLVRILAAGVCGGVIGYERQSRRKIAGLRTHVIVAVSSALMIILSKYGFQDVASEFVRVDPSRVASGVVTAIGFLGSGMIFFRNNSVSGLTTSAGMWATVGVGMTIGAGMYTEGIAVTLIILLVEMFLGRSGALSRKESGLCDIVLECHEDAPITKFRQAVEENGGKVVHISVKKKENALIKLCLQTEMSTDWNAAGFTSAVSAYEEVVKIAM